MYEECVNAIPIIQNEIPIAFSQMDSFNSSNSATIYNSQLNSSIQSSNTSRLDFTMRPSGCFLHTPTNEIYFNPEDGAPNYEDRQLCKSNCTYLFLSWEKINAYSNE